MQILARAYLEDYMNIILSEEEKRQTQKNIDRMVRSGELFDQEETFYGCTVQVLTNTKTGEVSVGWIRPDGSVARIV